MTQKESNEGSGMDRRTLLQATGVAAGSLVGMKNVSAQEIKQSAEKISEVEFVEVLIEHENTPDYPTAHADKFVRYMIGEDKLLLSDFVNKNDAYELVKNDKVINKNGEHITPQAGTSSEPPNKRLTISTGVDGRSSVILQLEEPYSPPSPNISRMNDELVKVNDDESGIELTVSRGEDDRVRLPDQKVVVRQKSDSFRTIQDPQLGEERKVRKRGELRSVEVTPVVTVKNHGRIDVYSRGGD
jgi:hypothetical protein